MSADPTAPGAGKAPGAPNHQERFFFDQVQTLLTIGMSCLLASIGIMLVMAIKFEAVFGPMKPSIRQGFIFVLIALLIFAVALLIAGVIELRKRYLHHLRHSPFTAKPDPTGYPK